jgi:heat shock protein HslJ
MLADSQMNNKLSGLGLIYGPGYCNLTISNKRPKGAKMGVSNFCTRRVYCSSGNLLAFIAMGIPRWPPQQI